jgi:hypothetical protein
VATKLTTALNITLDVPHSSSFRSSQGVWDGKSLAPTNSLVSPDRPPPLETLSTIIKSICDEGSEQGDCLLADIPNCATVTELRQNWSTAIEKVRLSWQNMNDPSRLAFVVMAIMDEAKSRFALYSEILKLKLQDPDGRVIDHPVKTACDCSIKRVEALEAACRQQTQWNGVYTCHCRIMHDAVSVADSDFGYIMDFRLTVVKFNNFSQERRSMAQNDIQSISNLSTVTEQQSL